MSPVTYSLLVRAARGRSGKLNACVSALACGAVNPDRLEPSSASESIGQHSLQSGTVPVRFIVHAPNSSGPSSAMSIVGSDPHSPFVTADGPFFISGFGSQTYGWYSNLHFSGSWFGPGRTSNLGGIPIP
jgi:hypothetical protein